MIDLHLKNLMLVDGSKVEIGIDKGIITHIGQALKLSAKNVFEARDNTIVSAGWIDSHVHCYESLDLYYDIPDEIGYKKGVTTLIDAGSSGEENISDFYKLANNSITNVYALMNISREGIIAQNELEDINKINIEKDVERIREFPDFIIGIKARMSKTVVGENGVIPLVMAKKIQSHFKKLPLMVHIGSAPPKLSEIAHLLEKSDIMTHCYNGKSNGILNEDGSVKDYVVEAYNNGVLFDVGHGTDSFNFDVAEKSIKQGVLANSISSDIYIRNRLNGPVFDLATTISKMMLLGVSLSECMDMVTKNPASIYGLKNKGLLEVGYDADLTLFTIDKSDRMLIDSNGNRRNSTENIVPYLTIINGNLHKLGDKDGSI